MRTLIAKWLARTPLAFVGVVAGLHPALPAAHGADRIVMLNGQEYLCTIIEESSSAVKIQWLGKGITLVLDPYEIDLIERDIGQPDHGDRSADAPEGDISEAVEAYRSSLPAQQAATPPQERVPSVYYAVVPISDIGISWEHRLDPAVTAAGLSDALNWLRSRKVEHVFFWIDSPGGLAREADQIVDVLQHYEDDFEYYALVKESISAAMHVTFSCDRMFVGIQGVQGAALQYLSGSSGLKEYDQKANAIAAKRLGSLAQRNGFSAALAEAMVLPEAELYRWREPTGRWGLCSAKSAAPSTAELEVLDRDDTVLALSSSDALELGLAEPYPGNLDAFGPLLGIQGWKQIPTENYPARLLQKAQERYLAVEEARANWVARAESARRKLGTMTNAVPVAMEAALRLDPSNYSYVRNTRSGLMTQESARQWTRRTDQALRAWYEVQNLIEEIAEEEDLIKKVRRRTAALESYWAFEQQAKATDLYLAQLHDEVQVVGSPLASARSEAAAHIRRLRSERVQPVHVPSPY